MKLVAAFGCVCLLAAAAPAAAEWHITPMIGLTFSGNTDFVDLEQATGKVHPDYGVAVTFLGGGVFAVEGLALRTPGFFKADGGLLKSGGSIALMGNAVVTVPRRWTEYFLRPFVSGGFGMLRASIEEVTPVFVPAPKNIASFNIGGGAVGFLTSRTGVRFDLRYYSNLHHFEGESPSAPAGQLHLRYMSATVGVVFRR